MNDNDVLDDYRKPLASLHMGLSADAVLARGDQRRHRRRVSRWAAAGGTGLVAVIVALVLVAGGNGAPNDRSGTQLAAFTISNGPAGASTVTLHSNSRTRLDPAALRQALAQRGITANVTVGSWCDTATEPAGLRQAVTVGHDPSGDPSLTIHPSAIPTGAELSIGYFTDRTVLALIRTNSPLTCATNPRLAAAQGQGLQQAIVITNG
jgi:hypothetical protein